MKKDFIQRGKKMIELSDIERKLEKVDKKMEENSLAMEMLSELKAQSKRKDIIIFVLIGIIAAMIIGFFIYESQFETTTETEEQYISQEQMDVENSTMSGVIN